LSKWECYRCGYVFQGDATPDECPRCHYSLTLWLEHVHDSDKPISVRSFVKTDYLTIDGDSSAWEAASRMKDNGVGNILVTINSKPVGIVTERDMLNKVSAQDLLSSKIQVRKIMSSPLITVTADTPLQEAMMLMAKNRIRTLFVTDKGEPMGILNMRSIAGDQFRVARALG
jgi:signal-transduction protein with cAMP-binding, CBS, and nucleotidyltransferase domain